MPCTREEAQLPMPTKAALNFFIYKPPVKNLYMHPLELGLFSIFRHFYACIGVIFSHDLSSMTDRSPPFPRFLLTWRPSSRSSMDSFSCSIISLIQLTSLCISSWRCLYRPCR